MADIGGQQLGNYRLHRLLGRGGFADVYLGEHIHLQTLAAIKVLQIEIGSESLSDFLLEARTIAHLIHPHIVRVLDFGVEHNMPFLGLNGSKPLDSFYWRVRSLLAGRLQSSGLCRFG